MKRMKTSILSIGLLIIGIIFVLSTLNNKIPDGPITKREDDKRIQASLNEDKEIPHEIILDNGYGQSFNVSLSSIPNLEKYLEDELDKKLEIDRIQIEFLDWGIQYNNYFVLKYGCGNKICNLILIQITTLNEVKTVYLGEGIYTDSEVFDKKSLLRITVNEGNNVVRHQIIIVDLITMSIITPHDKSKEELYFKAPLYPITEFKWLTANTIELVVADIPNVTYESLDKWYKTTNPPLKRVEITIE